MIGIGLLRRFQSHIIVGMGVLILVLISAVWLEHHWHLRTQQEFADFKGEVKAAGKKADREKADREREWQLKFTELEADHEKRLSDNRARFAVELERVRRARARGADGGGVSTAPAAIGVCADAAGNNRLSAVLSRFEEGVIRGFESCQNATDTLMACQQELKDITVLHPR